MTINLFKTTDIVLAASLKYNGYNLVSIERDDNKGVFVFEQVDNKVLEQYDLGSLRVEPITFNQHIRQLTSSVRRKLQYR